jgi:hypothetical protein
MDGAGTQAAFSHPSPSIARLANHHSWRPVHVVQEGGWQGHRSGTAQYRGGEDQGPAGVCVSLSLARSLSDLPIQLKALVLVITHTYMLYIWIAAAAPLFSPFFCHVQALLSCPTSSIHTEEPPKDILQVQNMFPLPIDDKLLPVCMFFTVRVQLFANVYEIFSLVY